MNLLNQQLGQLVKTKLASALQQDNLITQGSKDFAGNEFLYILEEELFRNLNNIMLLAEFRTNTNEFHNSTLAGEIAHFFI